MQHANRHRPIYAYIQNAMRSLVAQWQSSDLRSNGRGLIITGNKTAFTQRSMTYTSVANPRSLQSLYSVSTLMMEKCDDKPVQQLNMVVNIVSKGAKIRNRYN